MAYVDWSIEGVEVVRIDEGHFGDVRLDGLYVAVLYAWPGPIFEGNGALQAIGVRAAPLASGCRGPYSTGGRKLVAIVSIFARLRLPRLQPEEGNDTMTDDRIACDSAGNVGPRKFHYLKALRR